LRPRNLWGISFFPSQISLANFAFSNSVGQTLLESLLLGWYKNPPLDSTIIPSKSCLIRLPSSTWPPTIISKAMSSMLPNRGQMSAYCMFFNYSAAISLTGREGFSSGALNSQNIWVWLPNATFNLINRA